MALSKLFKKKVSVPDELPDLAIDELKKGLKGDNSKEVEPESPKGEAGSETPTEEVKPEGEETPAEGEAKTEEGASEESAPAEETPAEDASAETPAEGEQAAEETPAGEENSEAAPETSEETPASEESNEEVPKPEEESSLDPEKSFFNHLLKEMDEDISDVDKLSSWYNDKFAKENTVQEMKKHWHKQKDEMIIKSLGKEFKDKIDVKMKNLQKFEGDWQRIYFDLITKEEEIKKEELEMKKLIREFIAIFDKKPKQNIKKVEKV